MMKIIAMFVGVAVAYLSYFIIFSGFYGEQKITPAMLLAFTAIKILEMQARPSVTTAIYNRARKIACNSYFIILPTI